MNRFLLAVAAILATTGTIREANAQDQEFRHVIVTLTSGEKVDGYLKRGWHAESSVFKNPNYSFKITKTPEDKEVIKFTADSVISVDYTETTEVNPDGIRWESHDIASPGLTNRNRTFRRLVCVNKVGNNASVYWWKGWETKQIGKIQRRELVTYYGILFHNDPDSVVYPYMLVSTVMMDKQHRGLKEYCKNWFKGEERQIRKKKYKDDETWILDMYDAYLTEKQ